MTTKTMITELSNEQLKMVYNTNSQLKENISSDMYDTEMMYINEMLDFFKNSLSDYSISGYGYTYIKVDENSYLEFIEGIKKANDNFGMLPDHELYLIEELEKKIDQLHSETEMYTDSYDILESEILEDAQNIADMIDKTFKNILEYAYNEENGVDYLIEFYAHERIENTYIVTDENGNTDYILNEDITKTYN